MFATYDYTGVPSSEYSDQLEATQFLTNQLDEFKMLEEFEKNAEAEVHATKEKSFSIVVLTEEERTEGIEWPLEHPENTIGRSNQSSVEFESRGVSRTHCSIIIRGHKAYLKNLSKTLTTRLNERVIPDDTLVPLKMDDKIGVGPILLRFIEREAREG